MDESKLIERAAQKMESDVWISCIDRAARLYAAGFLIAPEELVLLREAGEACVGYVRFWGTKPTGATNDRVVDIGRRILAARKPKERYTVEPYTDKNWRVRDTSDMTGASLYFMFQDAAEKAAAALNAAFAPVEAS